MDTTQSFFVEHKYCRAMNQVDIKNDIFQLQSSSSDGFCIEGLSLRGEQMLGTDSSHYNCAGTGMTTSTITIQNNEIVIECKGLKADH